MAGVYFRINDWVLDVDENKLYRKDREVTAEPRLINLLSFLADNANQIFTREALILSVWERDTVADQVVTQSIFELRKLLADGRDDYPSYVITVPKRGYKLVADVSLMTATEFRAFRLSESCRGKEPEAGSESNDIRVTPKYDSVVKVTGKEIPQVIQKKRSAHLWRLGFLGITLISLTVSIIAVLTYKKPEVKKSHLFDTHLIEFKMQNNSGLNDDFVDGLTKKIMSDVAQVSDYRVMQTGTSVITVTKPGKSVVVRVRENNGVRFLEVEYRTHVSKNALYRRLYVLTDSDLRTVLQQASLSLMTILNVPEAKLKSSTLGGGLPMTPRGLKLFIQANHYLKVSDINQYQYGIELMEQALEIEPDNAYVQAELLIAYHVQKAFSPDLGITEPHLEKIRDALEVNVKMVTGQIQPRIYEALALHETVTGEMAAARQYLAQALNLRNSALSYVIRGKQAELAGNRQLADKSYSEALYIDSSFETYLLCQKLIFTSEIEVGDATDQAVIAVTD